MSWLHLITQDTYTSSFFAIAWSGLILSQHKKERQPGFSWAALPPLSHFFFSDPIWDLQYFLLVEYNTSSYSTLYTSWWCISHDTLASTQANTNSRKNLLVITSSYFVRQKKCSSDQIPYSDLVLCIIL